MNDVLFAAAQVGKRLFRYVILCWTKTSGNNDYPVISKLVGCFLPFIAKKLHLDPAVMCGPLTTTLVDIVTLLTYFLIWTLALAPALGM